MVWAPNERLLARTLRRVDAALFKPTCDAPALMVKVIANLNNVVVFRTVNSQKTAALFSIKDIRAGRLEDPQIYGNDIVIVGESAARRFFRDFGNMFPILGTFVPVL